MLIHMFSDLYETKAFSVKSLKNPTEFLTAGRVQINPANGSHYVLICANKRDEIATQLHSLFRDGHVPDVDVVAPVVDPPDVPPSCHAGDFLAVLNGLLSGVHGEVLQQYLLTETNQKFVVDPPKAIGSKMA